MRTSMRVLALLGAFIGGVPMAQAQTPPAAAPPAGVAAAKPDIQFEATPALWKVQGVHGTVYLFGSVHVMKKEVHWETAKIKDALAASSALYLEIKEVDPASQQTIQPIITQYGMDAAHPLSTKMSKEDVALLDAAAKKMGLPGEQRFEPMQPWLANLVLSLLPSLNAGYDGAIGIDTTIAAEASAAKKPILGFETAEQQVHLFADAPMAEQVDMLHHTLTDKAKDTTQLDDIVGDWTRGDVEKLAALENDELKVKSPKLYDRLLVKRNERFADKIAALLKDPTTGTIFVTVGAAHLAGPDSVQKMLETRGFTAVRVE